MVQIGFPFFSWVRFVGDFPLKIFQECKLAIKNPAPGCFERAKIAFTPLKTNMSPKKVTISVGNTSSNHHFSGDMLVFRGGCFSHCIDESEATKGFFVAAINCCITAIHMEHQGRSTPYIGAELIPPWDPFMIETLRKGVEKKLLNWVDEFIPYCMEIIGFDRPKSHTSLSLYQRIRGRNFDIQRFAKCVGVDDRTTKIVPTYITLK